MTTRAWVALLGIWVLLLCIFITVRDWAVVAIGVLGFAGGVLARSHSKRV